MIIGLFLSFGLGGSDKAMYYLINGLLENDNNNKYLFFYNKFSLPNPKLNLEEQTIINLYKHYEKLGLKLIFLDNVIKLKNYNLDIFIYSSGGNELWLLPNFHKHKFKFKIIEINYHGNLLTKADYRIFPSKSLMEFKKLKNKNFRYIYNPILLPIHNENYRNIYNIKNDIFVCGSISRSSDSINSDIKLICYKNIENENTIFLYLNPSQYIKKLAKKLLIKNIIFLPPTLDQSEITKFYNTIDVLCHSNSLGETFGNTIAESMIHGKPVISHSGNKKKWCQAQKELLINYANLYVDSDNKKIIIKKYTKILKQMKNKEYREKIGKNMQIEANEKFNYKLISNKYINFIKSI